MFTPIITPDHLILDIDSVLSTRILASCHLLPFCGEFRISQLKENVDIFYFPHMEYEGNIGLVMRNMNFFSLIFIF
jgi:hypothetical protein